MADVWLKMTDFCINGRFWLNMVDFGLKHQILVMNLSLISETLWKA